MRFLHAVPSLSKKTTSRLKNKVSLSKLFKSATKTLKEYIQFTRKKKSIFKIGKKASSRRLEDKANKRHTKKDGTSRNYKNPKSLEKSLQKLYRDKYNS